MKKRIFSLFLSLALLCGLLPQMRLTAHAEVYSGTCGAEGDGSNLTWSFDEDSGTLTITGSGRMADYGRTDDDLPDVPWLEEDGPSPDSFWLAAPWDEYGEEITAVSLQDGVTTIGNYAFCDCWMLTSVTIGSGVTHIGKGAFPISLIALSVASDNPNYSSVDSVLFNKSKTELLQYPAGKPESAYEIPDSVTSIGDYAFYDCALTSVTIPDSVTSIGDYAFQSCDALTSVTIPDGVTTIGDGAFSYCIALTSVTIPDGVTTIGNSAFSGCGALTSVTIPDGVTTIGDEAFAYCNALTSVTIGSGVTHIGKGAFDCDSLIALSVASDNPNYSSVDGVLFNKSKTELIQYPAGKLESAYEIPDGVTSIGESAFAYCRALTSVTIPDSVTSIGDFAFQRCDALTSVTIPDSVTSIGDFAFQSCDALTSVTIPDSVTSIGDEAFSLCWRLTSVTIGSGVTYIGKGAFDCHPLIALFVASDNPNYSSVDGVLFNKSKTELIQYPAGKLESAYEIPDGVTTIGDSAFSGCYHLTSVTIPDSVTSIGDRAFYDCALRSVTIPDSVTSIGHSAFYLCVNLTSVTIPDSVTSIGNYAFFDCVSLTSVTIPRSVTSIGEYAFGWCWWGGIPRAVPVLYDLDPIDGFTIYGYTGTAAQRYAEENEFDFVALSDIPTITSQPVSASVVPGKAVTFEVSASGENLSYQWYYKKAGAASWTKWVGKTSASISFKGISTNNGCQYRCIVSNEAGSVTSEAATLTVISKPVITAQPESASVVPGKAVTFEVSASGENLRYQWYYKKPGAASWIKWAGKTSASISFKGISTSNGCQYRCIVSNEAGSVTSEAATLTVISKPVITAQPESASVVLGQMVTFEVSASGENLRYQWYYKKPGAASWIKWAGKTSASISFKGISSNNGCQYRCIVSNEAGSVTSEDVTLAVLSSKQ